MSSKKRQQPQPRFIVDAHGKPTAVILDLETYESMAQCYREVHGEGVAPLFNGLLRLSEDTLGFWDNPIDDEVWSNA
jgi:hypothetical protein